MFQAIAVLLANGNTMASTVRDVCTSNVTMEDRTGLKFNKWLRFTLLLATPQNVYPYQ